MSPAEAPARLVLPPGHVAPLLRRPTPPEPPITGRLHWSVLVKPVVAAVQLAAPVVLVLLAGRNMNVDWIFWTYGILVVLQIAASAIRFATFTFTFTDDQLEMRWGLLSRRTRAIPVTRIINMTSRRALWHRICRAEEVRFETAGGQEEDAAIEALSREQAQHIRSAVRRRKAGDSIAAGEERHDEIIRRLTLWDAVLHGMTSNVLAAMGFIAGVVFDNLDSLDIMDVDPRRWIQGASVLQLSAAGFLLLMAVWFGSVFVSLVRFSGFTLRRSSSGDLSTRFGLVTLHEGRIFTGKVQSLVIHESLLRRPFRLASLKALSAGATAVEDSSASAEVLLPLARMHEVGTLIREVFPTLQGLPRLDPVHPLAVRRNMVRLSLIPVLIIAILTLEWTWGALALVPWAVLVLWLARKRYRNTGFRVLDDFVVVRRGLINRVTHVVPKDKLQTVQITRNPLDRRLGLSALMLDTAARTALHPARIPDIPPAKAAEIRAACFG